MKRALIAALIVCVTGVAYASLFGQAHAAFKRAMIVATGGNVTTYTTNGVTYRVHTFTNSGTFWAAQNLSVRTLIVASGGCGDCSGGGGGGLIDTNLSITSGSYQIIVGGVQPTRQAQGSNSAAFSLTAIGGGGGRRYQQVGGSGGSGGGAGHSWNMQISGGSGTSGQGYAGGTTPQATGFDPIFPASGGGGAGGAGGAAVVPATGGAGGLGKVSDITGASLFYAGGGGGASILGTTQFGIGGSGVGGNGGSTNSAATSGMNGSGGGGGGASDQRLITPGSGGSGIVIVRYAQ
jgi:hypothetical protein